MAHGLGVALLPKLLTRHRRILIASLDGARAVTVKEAMRRYLAEAVRDSCGRRARAQPVD